MSRQLPEKPNLAYLKKQAKELLRSGQHRNLADAQHTLANEYGFPTWAKLKLHVESVGLTPAEALKAAVCDSDASRVRELLERYPELRAAIDDPLPNYGFGQQALFAAVQRSDRATIDLLLGAGANIRKRTEWWAGGFGVLDDCHPSLVDFLTARGAVIDAHSAARLGMMPKLTELVAADPSVVHAKGGDGQTPLHFASTVEIARFLLEHGADINARDVDHESTPAQYMLRVQQKRHYPKDRQDVARYLVSRGCRTDILMAAALGRYESSAAPPGQRPQLHPDERIGAMVPQGRPTRRGHHLHLDARRGPHRAHGSARFRPRGGLPVADGAYSRGPEAGAGMRAGRRSGVSRISRAASRTGRRAV